MKKRKNTYIIFAEKQAESRNQAGCYSRIAGTENTVVKIP